MSTVTDTAVAQPIKKYRRRFRFSFSKLIIYILLTLWALTTIFPLCWVTMNAFKPKGLIRSNSFDFPKKEFSKYSSICHYAVQHKYAKEEILFLGDDFADGGGDSSVRLGGDIDYLVVEDYRSFPDLMEPYL